MVMARGMTDASNSQVNLQGLAKAWLMVHVAGPNQQWRSGNAERRMYGISVVGQYAGGKKKGWSRGEPNSAGVPCERAQK
jgi:hypothetical protein